MIEKIGRKSKNNLKTFRLSCDADNCNSERFFEEFYEAKNCNSTKDKRIKWVLQGINGVEYFNYCPECAKRLNIKPFILKCDNCSKLIEFDTWDKLIEYKIVNNWGNKKVEIDNRIMWLRCCEDCKPLLKLKKGVQWKNKQYE